MDDDKFLITDVVADYRKNHTKEKYDVVLKTIIENADHTFCMPVDIRLDQNALELKSIYKDNRSFILAYSSPVQMMGRKEGEIAMMAIENIIKKLLSSDYWDGIWLNPDPFITPDNQDNQCIISKSDVIKMINKLYK